MKRKRKNYKELITYKLNRISELTGETYVLNYDSSRGWYEVLAKDTKTSYAYAPKKLLYYRAPGRVLYQYIKGVLWGMGVNGDLVNKKIDYLLSTEKIDKETRMMLKRELATLIQITKI